ncbi:MAG: hypothetical protein ABIP17_04455 [Ilumatobacteraceae bacterium]
MQNTGVAIAIEALETADLGAADSGDCVELVRHVRLARGWLDAVEARISSRMTELYETDGAAPPADLHARCGGVSAADGKRKDRRSKAIDDAPAFGDALADGQIGAAHVDALADATAHLDDDVKTTLLDESPEQFARHLRDRARRLERDNGLERNARQRRETYLSRKLNLHTGMVEGRYAFHPELANQIFGAVDK